MSIFFTIDNRLVDIWKAALILEKAPKKKPKWAQDHGLEFDENKHRWIKPDTGETHEHEENDSRWEPKVKKPRISKPKENNIPDLSGLVGAEDSLEAFKRYDEQVWKDESKLKREPSYINARNVPALQHYTEQGFREINESWLEGNITSEAQEISKLMSSIGKEQLLWRGIPQKNFVNENGEPLQIGDTLTTKSFTSTSRSPKGAFPFGSETMFEFITSSDTKAITISDAASKWKERGERETIINAGRNY